MDLRSLLVVCCTLALVVTHAAAPSWAEANAEYPPEADTAGEDVVRTASTGAPHVTYTYEMSSRGNVHTDSGSFATDVRNVLQDARSWTLGGSIEFVPVASGGDLNIVLASPQAVDDAHEVCSPRYSCRVGDDVLINDENWRNPPWGAAAPTWLYRQYLIGHEVGHYLGFDDLRECPTPGAPAPLMLQQSIDLDGCEPNAWPLDSERDTLAGRLDVPVYPWIFPDVLVHRTHRDEIHLIVEEGIARGGSDGYFRPEREITRGQMATLLSAALGLSASDDPPFDDVDGDHPHAQGIAAVAEADIVSGHGDGTYRPSASVSRAQMATMLSGGFGLEAQGDPPFDDVDSDHLHAEGIAAVAEHDVAYGYEDGTFRPAERVTRGHMASFITRAHPDM